MVLAQWVSTAQKLSRSCYVETQSRDALANKSTLRGQLQRWRDKTAQTFDEGVQFVLENNLLNHLLVASDKAPSLNSFWLIKSCQQFYERALNAPYVPLYV